MGAGLFVFSEVLSSKFPINWSGLSTYLRYRLEEEHPIMGWAVKVKIDPGPLPASQDVLTLTLLYPTVNVDLTYFEVTYKKIILDYKSSLEKKISQARWSCHICYRMKPDRMISVKTHDTSELYNLPIGTLRQNVRYCNDNPECEREAETFRFDSKRKKEEA